MRLCRGAEHCSLVIDIHLARLPVLTRLLPIASVLTATYGMSDEAFVDAPEGLLGRQINSSCPAPSRAAASPVVELWYAAESTSPNAFPSARGTALPICLAI